MNYNHPFPATPGKPLQYWLESEMARLAPATSSSVLRDMAWTYGQWSGFAAAMAGLGGAVLSGGLLALVMMPGTQALWISLLLAGLGMLGVCAYIHRIKLPGIVRAKQPLTSRAPGRTSSGVGLAALMVVSVGAPMSLALGGWWSQGPGPALSLVVVALLFLWGTASVFVAPAWCAQHARQGFLRYIGRNPAVRWELEAMSLNWYDPNGSKNFGPL